MNKRCYQLTDAEKALLHELVDEGVDLACAARCSNPVAFFFGFVAQAAGVDAGEYMDRLLASRTESR